MELWNGLGWTFQHHLVQPPPRRGQGHLPADEVAQGAIQRDFEHFEKLLGCSAASLCWD